MKALRVKAGLSLRQLAKLSGVAPASLSKLETGKALLSWHSIIALADALSDALGYHVSLDSLRFVRGKNSEAL